MTIPPAKPRLHLRAGRARRQWGDSMRYLMAIAAALVLNLTATIAAEPTGTYRVEGNNPGNSGARYTGTVTVERTGETYRVTWVINNQRFSGTGIVNRDIFSVSYSASNQAGLAVYSEEAGNWNGIWTGTN